MNTRRNQTVLTLLFGFFLTNFCAEEDPLLPNLLQQSILDRCETVGVFMGTLNGFLTPMIIETLYANANFDGLPVATFLILDAVSSMVGSVYGSYTGYNAGRQSLLNTAPGMLPDASNAICDATKTSFLKSAMLASTMTLAVKLLPPIIF